MSIVKEIYLSPDKAIEYVKNNINKHDLLELSYNRIYAPGEVLDISTEMDFGEEVLIVTLHLNGDMVNDVVRVNMENIKNDLIEMRHVTDEEDIVIVLTED
ncbi:DUF2097 domain-containing protein [Methanobrevibacter curvatus]|uniref:DUF2097 domain-containing protein n=1 Tax=Methanobrevibacter curvatus TaxID=49547 RepID=A0A166BJJ1_9EURY|nr:DUF2097 domain-containing protein [Methanobrevibacter curvatus]KZX13442.1 hypothetical protein MBCUR_07060 [Methanobrevibacter curvatus]